MSYRGSIGDYGSHFPILAGVVAGSTGPVLELGAGNWSTPMLHYMCRGMNRMLVTADNDPTWITTFAEYRRTWHELHAVTDWAAFDLEGVARQQGAFAVAFIDCAPGEIRHDLIRRLQGHARYIIAHDSERDWETGANYLYETVTPLFKHVTEFRRFRPYTLILSDQAPFEIEPCDRDWFPSPSHLRVSPPVPAPVP